MNHTDRLRLLALNDTAFLHACTAEEPVPLLTARDVALVRLAALVTSGGAVASYGELVDAALDAGLTDAEIAEVPVRLVPLVGTSRIVEEVPKLALALGYDVEAALEQPPEH